MHAIPRLARATGAVLLLAFPAVADVIHVPAEQPTVAAAVAVAVDGDLILVSAGTYAQQVDVDGLSISIVGLGSPVKLRSVTVRNIPADESVLLQNLEIGNGFPIDANADAVTCLDCGGSVRIESCTVVGDWGDAGALFTILPKDAGSGLRLVNCLDVAVVHSILAGGVGGTLDDEDLQFGPTDGGPGANVRTSHVAFFDTVLQGGAGGNVNDTVADSGGAGAAGLLNVTGVVHLSGCTLMGGSGGWGDCEFPFPGCGAGGLGGDAIHQTTSVAAFSARDLTLFPGHGGIGGDGTPTPDGQVFGLEGGSMQTYSEPHRDLEVTSSVAEGEHVLLTVSGEVGDQLFLLVSLTPIWLEKPALQGLYSVSPPVVVQSLGTLAAPFLSLDAVVPELGPGLTHLVGRVQLVVGDAGGILLGPSSTLVLRDAAE